MKLQTKLTINTEREGKDLPKLNQVEETLRAWLKRGIIEQKIQLGLNDKVDAGFEVEWTLTDDKGNTFTETSKKEL